MVALSAGHMIAETGRICTYEKPRLPRTRCPMKIRYCCQYGLLSPSSVATCSIWARDAFFPAIRCAGVAPVNFAIT